MVTCLQDRLLQEWNKVVQVNNQYLVGLSTILWDGTYAPMHMAVKKLKLDRPWA